MAWGVLIVGYLFLAGVAASAYIMSAIVDCAFHEARRMRVGGRAISFVLMGAGLVMLMVDAEAGLHDPLRFFLLVSNPGSVMSWGAVIVSVFMLLAFVTLLFEVLKRPVPRPLAVAGSVAGILVAMYTGFLLGVVKAHPLWNNAALPILFLFSALSTGAAAVGLIGLLADREEYERMRPLKRAHLAFLACEAVVLFAMLLIVASGSSEGAASVLSIVAGEYAPLFWGCLVAAGLALPIAATVVEDMAEHASVGVQALSALAEAGVLAGGFALRYLIVFAAVPVVCVM